MQNNFLQAALDYAGRGFSVIPVRGDKKPFIPWTEYQARRATRDEIRAWAEKYPGAMIGIITGEISGIFVIDIDTTEGYQAIRKFIPGDLLFPVVKTPRGGWHLWFIYPVGSKLTVGTGIVPGVDFRGEGGYIVAPPSCNGDGRAYAWQKGFTLNEFAPPPIPDALLSALKNNIYHSFHTERCGQDRPQETTKTTTDHSFFNQGNRDDSLFHTANCLMKGGCEIPFVEHVIDILARNSNPPFPENEIRAKIDSALKRIEAKDRDLSSEIREWSMTTTGHFMTTDVHRELQLTTRREQKTCYMVLSRLCEGVNPILEKYGERRGCFRRIETDIELVNFLTASTNEFPITWPMNIDDHCIIYPGNIIIVAGSKSAGKTSFLLNTVLLNMHRHEIVYLNSEMGDTEFRKRLELFDGVSLSSWRMKAYHRASNFSDLITPEKKIFIVDFLEVTTDFWKVAQYIQEIHKKLKAGVCIIALQKSDGKDAGRGGDFSKEKARLYLSLDYFNDQKMNRIKITDAKAWRTDRNPRGMYRNYKLVQGSRFIPVDGWSG